MEASKTIIKGAIDGMTENQYLLGEKYFYGSGETRNVALAESWYKEAAKRGHVSATYMLGYILLTGAAGKTDMRKGTALVKKAAAKNHVKASRKELLLRLRNKKKRKIRVQKLEEGRGARFARSGLLSRALLRKGNLRQAGLHKGEKAPLQRSRKRFRYGERGD